MELFANFCFDQFLHDVIIILFYRSKQNNFLITSRKNWKQVKTQKSTNTLMSILA